MALCVVMTAQAQKVIPLYSGAAPGSENWTWQEQDFKIQGNLYAIDVSKPGLVAYLPSKPNGTAIIVAPGGAFHALALDLEGTSIAKRLNEKGITVFVLKYRLVHDDTAHPERALMTFIMKNDTAELNTIYARIVPLAMQDGLTAVKYVRQHAADYHLERNKIGLMGFSAGGTVAMSVVYNAGEESRPNFIVPIYAALGNVIGTVVPTGNTPIFIAVASDDDFGLAPENVQLYEKWLNAKQPAELHVYEKGGHGFGLKKQGLPVDTWMDRFEDWLLMQGYMGG